MKMLVTILLLPISLLCEAQKSELDKIKKDIESIKSIEEAKVYLRTNPAINGDIVFMDPKLDSSAYIKQVLTKKLGETWSLESDDKQFIYLFKVLKVDEIQSFRVQYIFFDNHKLSLAKIDSLRSLILERIRNDEQFEALAKQYSMDGNAQHGGDLGWFEETEMMKDFVNSVKAHDFGKIFKVDLETEKWYYLVKNTHKPRVDKKCTVIYIAFKQATN